VIRGRIGETASRVRIIQAPTLESATDTSAIVPVDDEQRRGNDGAVRSGCTSASIPDS